MPEAPHPFLTTLSHILPNTYAGIAVIVATVVIAVTICLVRECRKKKTFPKKFVI